LQRLATELYANVGDDVEALPAGSLKWLIPMDVLCAGQTEPFLLRKHSTASRANNQRVIVSFGATKWLVAAAARLLAPTDFFAPMTDFFALMGVLG